MAIPTYEDCMLPFLKAISNGGSYAIRDLIERIADALSLSHDERMEMLSSGQRAIANRVGWARTYLKKAGLLQSPQRGMMQITERGRDVLAENPARIDTAYLKQRFPEFRDWVKAKPETVTRDPGPAVTPEEIMESAYNERIEQVASDLLERLQTCNPYFFERVVVQLLRAMGYGGISGRGWVTQKSRDGGIDGMIYEDKLGLGNVCVQAKRWDGTVGRKTVQEFVGSMDLYRSRKGVIFTTSLFSADAKEYVERIEGKKVVLIAGEELARLMIEHRVGVTVTKSYDIVDVSQDFFDEEA
jgi:restriction system protein